MKALPWRRSRHTRQVTLYGKPGCHLCEDARALLDSLHGRHSLAIEYIDIRRDTMLYRRYDIMIPVIVIDGEIELHAPISSTELKRALRDPRR